VQTWAETKPTESFRGLVANVRVDALLDQQPGAGRAGLPGVLDDRSHDGRDRAVEDGVGEDDVRRLPSELDDGRDDVLGRSLRHETTDLGGAGKAEVVDAGMAGECRTRFLAKARHDVEGPLRQTRL